jgi:hypothetical protein
MAEVVSNQRGGSDPAPLIRSADTEAVHTHQR